MNLSQRYGISLKPTLLGALCGAFAFGIAPAMAQPGCDPDPNGSTSGGIPMCYEMCEEGPLQDRLDCRDRCEDTFRSCFWWLCVPKTQIRTYW
jgi:hypothetical protein